MEDIRFNRIYRRQVQQLPKHSTVPLTLLNPALAELELYTDIWNYRRSPREAALGSRTVVFESEIVVHEDVRNDCFLSVRGIESSRTVGSKKVQHGWLLPRTRKVKSHQARLPYPQMGNFASTSVSLATEPLREASTKR